MRVKLALISLAAVMPLAALGQFDFGEGASASSSKPWTLFKLNPKKTVKLSLATATADGVISLYEQISGISIVKDPALTGKLPITSATAVNLDTAFQILQTTLSLKGFDMTKEGGLLVIRSRGGNRGPGGGNRVFDPGSFPGFPGGGAGGGDPVLKVYPITYANAAAVAKVINDVYTGAPAGGFGGGNPFGGFRGRGGGGGGLNIQLGGAGGQQPGGGGNFGRNQISVKASSDDFSNSVIINAPDREQIEVKGIIDKIDKQTDQPQTSRVYRLTYAAAGDVAPVIQNVLVSNAPAGKGGMTQNNIDPGQRFQQALRFGSPQASFGQVASDTRTNSLVVTATPENQDVVGRVIRELDTPIETQTTTFVFPLQNAKATDVANLLLSAFGQRQGVSSNTTRAPAVTTHIQGITATQGTTSSSSSGGGSRPPSLGSIDNGDLIASASPLPAHPAPAPVDGGNDIHVELQDPSATSGELLTSVGVTQGFGGGGQRPGGGGFGGGFGGQSQSQQSTAPQLSRGAGGQIVNIKDLTGTVTAIADPNTNSVIVVTTPDGADIIKKVLDQLDKIPSQVVIQTMIVEASLDASDKLGVEWTTIANNLFHQTGAEGIATTNFGGQTQPPAQGFSYTVTSNNLDAYVNALKTDTKFRVLSTPRIFTSNNVTAQINISQSIPYVTSSIESTTGTFSYNYAFVDVGIILTVTPQITANGYVTMDVTQTANTLESYTSFNAPIVDQREATTTVSVKDNETVILGGIIQRTVTSTVNKVPILGDIPILGKLFQSSSKDDQRTELLVFMTPRIVANNKDAQDVTTTAIRQLGPETQNLIRSMGTTITLPPLPSNVNVKGKGTSGGGTPAPTGTPAPSGTPTTGGPPPPTGGAGTGGN
jgi:general secretion pathway protein D